MKPLDPPPPNPERPDGPGDPRDPSRGDPPEEYLAELLAASERSLEDHDREAQREIEAHADPAADRAVLERFRTEVLGTSSGAGQASTRPSWSRWLAAAALVLATLSVVWKTFIADPIDEDQRLGGSDGPFQLEVSTAGDSGSLSFEWSGAPEGSRSFVVRLFDGAAGGTWNDRSPHLSVPRWAPDNEEIETWPNEIRAYVEAFGSGSQQLLSRTPELRFSRTP